MSGNKLDEVTYWISDLINLEELDLSYNKLATLPGSIAKLNNLKKLHLHGNKGSLGTIDASQIKKLRKVRE